MKQYMGKDIREVVLDSGPPMNAMDMGDGTRAFQFRWGGGPVVIPQTTTTTGSVTSVGNASWFNARSITSPGGVVTTEGCIITYLSKWDASRDTWIVSGYRYPKGLFCD